MRLVLFGHALKRERRGKSSEGGKLGVECKHCNKKREKFLKFINTIFTTLYRRVSNTKVARVGILGEDCLNCGTQRFRIGASVGFVPGLGNCPRVSRRRSYRFDRARHRVFVHRAFRHPDRMRAGSSHKTRV